MGSPEPSQIVDRESEVEVFSSMLRFESSRRVMVVCDRQGRGKTALLRKLRYQCEYVVDPPVPVALFDFDTEPVTDEIDVVTRLAEDLGEADDPVPLPTFEKLNHARTIRDTGQFVQAWQSVQGAVDLSGASVSGEAQAAGVIQNIHVQHVETLSFPEWTEPLDRHVRKLCKEAFFSDLLRAAQGRPVVLLLDTVDAADQDMRRWLLRDLLRRRLLSDWEHHRLLLLIAGTDVDQLLEPLTPEQQECLEPVATLKSWGPDHVRAFLQVHGYDGFSDEEIDVVQKAIEAGKSLVKAMQVAEIMKDTG
ncbi:hypothetical protein [Nocardioides caldifontis]|uniref:hypothetical protein n=1 Tax=Nocardioides caldifontis TaxID=2588938 RepID=UPI0011DF13C5|nr:hypothetical protein [Nocardioides caldifontis]